MAQNHLSGRLQAVYDAFYDDANKKRIVKQAEKERRMMEMSKLMNNGATAENMKGMSEEEAAALRAAVEAEMTGGHADAKALNDELMNKRKMLRLESQKKKEDEKARINAENEAMRERLKNTKAATDNDVSDDAGGAARRRAAKESAQRRKAEQAALAKANKEQQRRIKETKARTDDDVTDEALGQARVKAAKSSKARKAAEAEALAAENAEFRHMIATTGAATDNDVTDDATGAARRKAAKDLAAAQKREKEEAAGAGRIQAAKDSKARKEANAAQLAAENAAHEKRKGDIAAGAVETDASAQLW